MVFDAVIRISVGSSRELQSHSLVIRDNSGAPGNGLQAASTLTALPQTAQLHKPALFKAFPSLRRCAQAFVRYKRCGRLVCEA